MPGRSREGAAATQRSVLALRTAMVNGDLAPGQRLVEAELADMFAATRASVRAALIELTGEGLVERIPNRGARVRVVSVAEAIAITECRMVLEGLCAAKAATGATDEQLAALDALGHQLRDAVANADPVKYSALNRQLHRLVREYSGQPIACELLDRLNAQIVRHQFQLSLRPGRLQVSLPEHLALITAITERDPQSAEQAARGHLTSVIEALAATAP